MTATHSPTTCRLDGKTPSDAYAALHAAAFSTTPPPWSAESFAQMSRDNAIAIFEARIDNALAGLAVFRTIGDETELLTLCRCPSFPGRQVGSSLLEAGISHAERAKCARILLEVAETNHVARNLYSKYAFAIVGRRPGYYRNAMKAPVDALILSKILTYV